MALDGRFKVSPADKKYNTPAYQRLMEGNPAYQWAPRLKAKAKFKRDKRTSANET